MIDKAVALALAIGDATQYARGLITLAEGLSWQGRHNEAQPFAQQAYALAEQQGAWEIEIRALIVLAWYCETKEQRLAPVAQALQLAQQHGDPYFELLCLHNMAGACENEGEYARSLPYRLHCLELARAAQDLYQIALATYLCGLVHVHLGLYTAAVDYFQQSLTLAQEHSFTGLEKSNQNRLAMAYTCLGQIDSAQQFSAQARALSRGAEEVSPFAAFVYSRILAAQGKWTEQALLLQRLLLQKRAKVGIAPTTLLPELAALAQLALRQNNLQPARTYVKEILDILDKQSHFSMSDLYFDYYAIPLACYQVLQAWRDGRAATILATSYQKLRTEAEQITDATVQRAYLENVSANRELIAAWQSAQQEQSVAESPSSSVASGSSGILAGQPPVALTPLIGREREVTEIVSLLQQPISHLLTLVGPGGMGKTRLAMATASASRSTFTDGVIFVPLASLPNAAALIPTLATILGLSVQGDPLQSVLHHLQDKQLLLILDNFEHLLEGADLVVTILQRAPRVQILATSRERLNLQSEQIYTVKGLAFSASALLVNATEAAAVRLFVQSVRRVQPFFQLDEANLAAVLHICQAVEGMPLGLELAAARADEFTLAEVAQAIKQGADFLAVQWRDIPLRQRSIRAVFAWSWRLLNATEQRILRGLAIFRGTFTQAAGSAVVGATTPLLLSLVHKSLLRRATPTVAGEERYEIHELLRQFAQAELTALPQEYAVIASRHSSFYLAFVATREKRLTRNESRAAIAEIQREWDNVRQAWLWAAHHADYTVAEIVLATSLEASAYSLAQFYLLTGLYTEGVTNFHLAVEGITAMLATTPATQSATSSTAKSTMPAWLPLLSQLQAIEANLLVLQGNYEAALTTAQRATDLNPAGKNSASALISAMVRIYAFYYKQQFAAMRAQAEELLQRIHEREARAALPEEQGATRGKGPDETLDEAKDEIWYDAQMIVYLFLGAIAKNIDHYDVARVHFTNALQLCQRLGKVRGEMQARLNLANLARAEYAYSVARQDYEQVLHLARAVGYRWGEGIARYELADVMRGQGDYSQGLAMFASAMEILRALNDPRYETYALADLSRFYCALGDYTQAEALLQQAWALDKSLYIVDVQLDILLAGAMYYYHIGNQPLAAEQARNCLINAQAENSLRYEGLAAIYLGYALEGLGQWVGAQAAYTSALTLYQTRGIQSAVVDAQGGLARTSLAQGDRHGAQRWIEEILPHLVDPKDVGIDGPFLLYLTGYRVLTELGDPRAATVLQAGALLLQQRAERITDSTLRRCFLENVTTHRDLLQHWVDSTG